MLLVRAKGLTRAQATTRHALKNAMVPILPSIIGSFVGILGGSMIIEQIFSIPGVGRLYIQAINLRDYDVFMTDTVFYTFIGLLAGAGFYTVSIIGFIAMMLCLSIFPRMERYFKNKSNHFEVHLELKNKDNLQNFVTTIRKLGLRIDDIEVNPAYINSGLSVYSIALTIQSNELKKYKTHTEIIEALKSIEYVHHIEEMT